MKNPKEMVVGVLQQHGIVDCGLFAIVYVVSLANGKDPAKKVCTTTYDGILHRLHQEETS